jgi:type III restriction enzyme
MKLELKSFQETAARDIISELDDARVAAVKGKLQAVVLAAPTGSGKTITLAQVIDYTFGGGDGIPARPNTVFLWLSDSPELNTQSKNKLLGACDHLPFNRMLTIESENFKEDELQPGYVYFINTQLLGKDKLLTKEGGGDLRNTTFWQTVARTIARAPQDFILIIDEAHRGANASEKNRTTIMQKFIVGFPADGMPSVPLVLGMSATPQRFTTLLGNTNRTQRPINIDPEEVRASGLLKDLIIVHNPKTNIAGDLTLLEQAARTWKQFTKQWEDYCVKEKEKDIVRPILVVQVEDGTEGVLTRTSLEDVLRVIERQTGSLAVNEIVHCFQDSAELSISGKIIRKLEASRIQDSPDAKVVLFKTALSTGWDCPRAEVMMSFRRAEDPTSIAQLVGRMVRTPLARRIGTNEVLDTVELFLPHYNREAVEKVLESLRNPTDGVGVRAELAAETYGRNPAFAKVFEHLSTLPTYAVSRIPKMSEVKRALRLAGLLMHEGLNQDADEEMREIFLKKLKELRDQYAKTIAEWGSVLREGGEIEVESLRVVTGSMSIDGAIASKLTLSVENIEQLFDAAGRLLAAGEGLHRTYWKRFHDQENPNQAKLELIAIMRQSETVPTLEKFARVQFDAWWNKHKAEIKKLSASVRVRFNALIQSSGKAAPQDWELPDQIVEKKEGSALDKHLFCDADGKFFADMSNTWESGLLADEMKKNDFVCWLRNMDRRDWALCVPYEMGGVTKPFFPDFAVVRKAGKGFVVDILEPHNDSYVDALPKAIGLAKFAEEHGEEFGRFIFARKVGNNWQYADMSDKETRDKTLKMQPGSEIGGLFV